VGELSASALCRSRRPSSPFASYLRPEGRGCFYGCFLVIRDRPRLFFGFDAEEHGSELRVVYVAWKWMSLGTTSFDRMLARTVATVRRCLSTVVLRLFLSPILSVGTHGVPQLKHITRCL